MKSKDTKYLIVIGALLVAIAWLFWSQPEPARTRIQVIKDNNAQIEADIARLAAHNKTLAQKHVDDSLKALDAAKAFKRRILGLEAKLKKTSLQYAAAPELDSVRMVLYPQQSDTTYCMPITAAREAFKDGMDIVIKDSIIVTQAARIDAMGDEKQQAVDNVIKMLGNAERMYHQQVAVTDNMGRIAKEYQQEAKRAKVGGWLKTGLAAVASFFVGKASN